MAGGGQAQRQHHGALGLHAQQQLVGHARLQIQLHRVRAGRQRALCKGHMAAQRGLLHDAPAAGQHQVDALQRRVVNVQHPAIRGTGRQLQWQAQPDGLGAHTQRALGGRHGAKGGAPLQQLLRGVALFGVGQHLQGLPQSGGRLLGLQLQRRGLRLHAGTPQPQCQHRGHAPQPAAQGGRCKGQEPGHKRACPGQGSGGQGWHGRKECAPRRGTRM